jgi:hypothetical protein
VNAAAVNDDNGRSKSKIRNSRTILLFLLITALQERLLMLMEYLFKDAPLLLSLETTPAVIVMGPGGRRCSCVSVCGAASASADDDVILKVSKLDLWRRIHRQQPSDRQNQRSATEDGAPCLPCLPAKINGSTMAMRMNRHHIT